MRTAGIFLLYVLALLSLASCRQVRYIPVETVRVDSTVVHDTSMYVRLVPYKDSVATRDTSSFLSNPYGYSWAQWSDGLLHHSLGIWPFATTQVEVPYFIDRYVTVTKPQIVEVEKKLSRWQQFKQDVGGVAIFAVIAVILIVVVYMVYKLKKGDLG